VDPAASPGAIAAAYRRKARVLHPDVPGTGDATAFIRLKRAYDVLSDPLDRAAYDRSAMPVPAPRSAPAPPPPPMPVPARRWRPDVQGWLSLGLAGLFCSAAALALVRLAGSPPRARPPPVHSTGPGAAPVARSAPPAMLAVPASGPATFYVQPPGSDAVVWRRNAQREGYVPVGRLAVFSPVQPLGLDQRHGLVEIALADGGTGFVDAARLAAGDRADARRAYCVYNAGAPPRNGELLGRRGDGTAHVQVSNQGIQSAVVKLREDSGRVAATVFLSPGKNAVVDHLPEALYRPEFAIGEVWSRACNSFSAGMRAQRLVGYAAPSELSPLVIPPDLSAVPAPEDIPDAAFARE
jgi:hypothetical protein